MDKKKISIIAIIVIFVSVGAFLLFTVSLGVKFDKTIVTDSISRPLDLLLKYNGFSIPNVNYQ